MRSAFFLVPGIMGILICLVTIILTSMSVSKEKEQGTFEMLASAPIESREILLGKSIPFVLLGMVNLPLILSTAIFLFGVPMRGSMIVLILATVVFVCVTVAIGILISTISKTQQQSMMGGFIFLLPAVLLSGLMFPLENMPAYMQFFGWLNPLTYYNRILRTIMLKGGDATQIACDITILIVMGIVLAWISGKRFKTTL